MDGVENTPGNSQKTYVIVVILVKIQETQLNFHEVMRLGKPLEHLQAALRATLTAGPIEETLTTIARQLGYFGYLTYDAVVWVRPSDLHPLTYNPCQ